MGRGLGSISSTTKAKSKQQKCPQRTPFGYRSAYIQRYASSTLALQKNKVYVCIINSTVTKKAQ
jgi:hypothetical protein